MTDTEIQAAHKACQMIHKLEDEVKHLKDMLNCERKRVERAREYSDVAWYDFDLFAELCVSYATTPKGLKKRAKEIRDRIAADRTIGYTKMKG